MDRRGVHDDEVGGRADLEPVVGPPHDPRAAHGRHVVERLDAGPRGELRAEGQQEAHLERIAGAEHGEEPVLDHVLPVGDVHSRGEQLAHAREAPAAGLLVADAPAHQLGGEHHHAHPGAGHQRDHLRRVAVLVRGERRRVVGGHAPVPARLDGLDGIGVQGARPGVVGLVDVHLHVAIEATGQLEGEIDVSIGVSLDHLRVGHATHDVGPTLDGAPHQLVGARVAPDALLGEGDQLDPGEMPAALPGGQDPVERPKLDDGVDVDVRADQRHAVSHQPVDHPRGPVGNVFHRVGTLDLAHDGDGLFENIGRILPRAVRGEGLVEMDVGLDERRRGQAPGGVELLGGPGGDARGDRGDAAAGDADVGEVVAVAKPRVPDDQVHRLTSATQWRVWGLSRG